MVRRAKPESAVGWREEYRLFLVAGRAVGSGWSSGPVGRLHTALSAGAVIVLAGLASFQAGLNNLEDSSLTNTAIDRGKTLLGSLAAAFCSLLSIYHNRPLKEFTGQLEESVALFDLRGFSLRPTFRRSLVLGLFLCAVSAYEILFINYDYPLSHFSYLVEYYSHLVIQAVEYQFVAVARSLSAMLESLRAELAASRSSLVLWRARLRAEQLVTSLAGRLSDLFGPYLFASFLVNFIVILSNLYFSLVYLSRSYTTGEAVPQSSLMYCSLNLYILLRIFEVLSSVEELRKKAHTYVMEFNHLVLRDATRKLSRDETILCHIESRQEIVMYAGDMLKLDFSLLTDMAGAWTTFLVVLLQFQLRPCQPPE